MGRGVQTAGFLAGLLAAAAGKTLSGALAAGPLLSPPLHALSLPFVRDPVHIASVRPNIPCLLPLGSCRWRGPQARLRSQCEPVAAQPLPPPPSRARNESGGVRGWDDFPKTQSRVLRSLFPGCSHARTAAPARLLGPCRPYTPLPPPRLGPRPLSLSWVNLTDTRLSTSQRPKSASSTDAGCL